MQSEAVPWDVITPDVDQDRVTTYIGSCANIITSSEVDYTVKDHKDLFKEESTPSWGSSHDKGLWGLVNNAGLNVMGDVELTTMEQYLTVGNTNLYGMVRMCKAFLPLLRQAKGRIVNVTSVKGLCAIPSCASYTMAKFGGEAFSETLRQEMSQFGVKVSIIEPCNFGGATGCLNEAALRRIKADFDEMWREASNEVKEFYGHAHLVQQFEGCKNAANTTAPTIDPVLDAFEDALRNPCPKVRYLIPGSNSFFDFYQILAFLISYMPQALFDKIRAYFVPYAVYK